MPNQSWAALDICDKGRALAAEGKKTYSIVGHSLGGGLAQLVGYVAGTPFVTFNAPGMAGNLPVRVKKAGQVKGFNMILWTDPVGNAGQHIGKTERFYAYLPFVPTTIGGTGRFAHVMSTVLYTLKHSKKWAAKTLDQLI